LEVFRCILAVNKVWFGAAALSGTLLFHADNKSDVEVKVVPSFSGDPTPQCATA